MMLIDFSILARLMSSPDFHALLPVKPSVIHMPLLEYVTLSSRLFFLNAGLATSSKYNNVVSAVMKWLSVPLSMIYAVPDTEVDLAAGRSASVTSRLKSMLKDARQEPLIRPMATDLAQAEITHELVVH